MSSLGNLLFARYALPPNLKKYCGGKKSDQLLYYVSQQISDGGLERLLDEFSVPPVYMQAISKDNAIRDIFHPRAVEAYWLGNELLYNVQPKTIHKLLKKRFGPQLSPKQQKWLWQKIPCGLAATHSFHVFEIHRRVGFLPRTVETMDNCRVSWGKVNKIFEDKDQLAVMIQYRPLSLKSGQVVLDDPIIKKAKMVRYESKISRKIKTGDWVSLHWNYVCDVLNTRQLNNLRRFTLYHIHLANQTI